uniref:GIY-YIG homing endonuclease n=1 Tax=Cyathus striatus TaxID=68777 RepID=UPI0023F1BBC9|nr:GIY-YIG homing endonuclease [Cyathus striatus]WDS46394.1 GIY-YIG homing endonuclease [Cyathus striatus]WDS46429.1 GIY-YIG homing endonuclease [Cyathus striatus]
MKFFLSITPQRKTFSTFYMVTVNALAINTRGVFFKFFKLFSLKVRKISRSSTIILRPFISTFYKVAENSNFPIFQFSNFPNFIWLLATKALFKKEHIYFLYYLFYKPSLEAKAKVNTMFSCYNKTSVNFKFTLGLKKFSLFVKQQEKFSMPVSGRSNYSTLNIKVNGDNSSNSPKDKFPFSLSSSIKYLDKYDDFSYKNRKFIKDKYYNKRGIYLWVNNSNNKSYVGKSVNLFNRLNKNYLSSDYINRNKNKMSICAAIYKYGIQNFSVYILEIIDLQEEIGSKLSKEFLSQRENYWHSIINPSYNIAAVLKPFTGINHYRFGKKLSDSVKIKISNSLKGRIQTEIEKANHVLGARKKKVYCFDWETKAFIMEFEGIRIMERVVKINNINIRQKIDTNKPFICCINNINYKLLLKSKK